MTYLEEKPNQISKKGHCQSKMSPKDKYAFYYRGVVSFKEGDPFCEDDFNRAIEIDSSFTWAYVYRGFAKNNRGMNKDIAGAIEDFDKAMNMYDTRKRVQVVFNELLHEDITGKKLLDAGCGTGWFSQRY